MFSVVYGEFLDCVELRDISKFCLISDGLENLDYARLDSLKRLLQSNRCGLARCLTIGDRAGRFMALHDEIVANVKRDNVSSRNFGEGFRGYLYFARIEIENKKNQSPCIDSDLLCVLNETIFTPDYDFLVEQFKNYIYDEAASRADLVSLDKMQEVLQVQLDRFKVEIEMNGEDDAFGLVRMKMFKDGKEIVDELYDEY